MVKRELEFEKDPDGKWYAIIPEWQGEKSELEMVCGADDFLNHVTKHDRCWITFSDEEFEGSEPMHLVELMQPPHTGAYYHLKHFKGVPIEQTMWLCDVTKVMFIRGFPDVIYID